MKKLFPLIFTLVTLLSVQNIKADEGMWLPFLLDRLNYSDLTKAGLELSPEEIYSINNSSIKDAIIQFGNGCTGEIVSASGLIFTNHHCGYGAIQSQSTVENDYLTYGFWAANYGEELPIEGLTARFLYKVEDVTDEILENITASTPQKERNEIIEENSKKITEKYDANNEYETRIASFFNGNQYFMFFYKLYKDVRLVGAPPSSIGKFGADTDNWMWPRHTGDFAIFRVYTDTDNNPADYDKNNVPLKTEKYLPISIKPKKQNDFAMIIGYPGSTDRYANSQTINWATEYRNPMTVKIRTQKLDILRKDMAADPAVRIKYASKYASSSNYWKYYIGETRGLKNLKIMDRKKSIENKFQNWVNLDKDRKDLYGNTLSNIDEAYKIINEYETGIRYSAEALMRGPEIIAFTRNFHGLKNELEKENPDLSKIESYKSRIKTYSDNYFKNYNVSTDKKLLSSLLELFCNDVPENQQPEYILKLKKKHKNNFDLLAEKLFAKTIFADKNLVDKLIENPNAKTIAKDPAYMLQLAVYNNYIDLYKKTSDARNLLYEGRRLFTKGVQQMNPNVFYYPDANSTMRLSYGSVQPYSPADAVRYDFVTTLDGVMAKENPDAKEFIVMPKLKELHKSKDYGRYGEDGKMVVCFLTNNDITGGNSGSPVLNGKGELIGLAFDGNWEAMSGNFAFEPELQRTINVDIRYVLFIIDKYANAQNIIDELDIRE